MVNHLQIQAIISSQSLDPTYQVSRHNKTVFCVGLLLVDGSNIFFRNFVFYPTLHYVTSHMILKFVIFVNALTGPFGFPPGENAEAYSNLLLS
jgi:hypothetical protein